MKFIAASLAACLLLIGGTGPRPAAAAETAIAAVYRPQGEIKSVAVFLSGDGGWELGVVPMAKRLVAQGALVVGMNTPRLLAGLQASGDGCIDPAQAILGAAHRQMTESGAPAGLEPVLVGYSSGAVLAYTSLVQARAGSFGGGIGLGFCPDLETRVPLCPGEGLTHVKNSKGPGFVYDAAPKLAVPFIALQGAKDEVCDPAATNRFVTAIQGARIVNLPQVGHGFSVPKHWVASYDEAFQSLAARGAASAQE